MRYIVFLLFLFYLVCGFSQKKEKYTFYLIGRPNSFEKNNAIKEVQGKWKLRYVSAGSGCLYRRIRQLNSRKMQKQMHY